MPLSTLCLFLMDQRMSFAVLDLIHGALFLYLFVNHCCSNQECEISYCVVFNITTVYYMREEKLKLQSAVRK